MKFLAALLLVLLASLPALAQTTARRVVRRASAPATCREGDIYFNTTDKKLYRCTATNTWTETGGGTSSESYAITGTGGAGFLSLAEQSPAPGTPAANTLRIYAKDSGGVSSLYFKKDDGTEVDLSAAGGSGLTSLNGQTGTTQTFAKADDTNVTLTIGSATNTHTFTMGWTGALAKARQHAATVYNDQANTFSTGAQDFGAATSLKVPTGAGAAPTASGLFAYDSTANVFKGGANGAGKTFAFTDSSITGNAATATALAANPADCAANQFANAIGANGDLGCAQPSFSNLSGTATDAQIPNNITVDLATQATTALAGDSATGFFPSGNLETARVVTGTVTNERCLRVDASGNIVVHSGDCGSGGGSSTAFTLPFYPLDNEAPASNYATLDTRNGHPVLDFDDTTQESAVWTGVVPGVYAGGTINVCVTWAATSATTGTIGFDAAIERINDEGQDLDADGFATAQTITATTIPATSGHTKTVCASFTQSQADSIAANDAFRLRIRRDVANDNASGDAELVVVSIRSN